MSKASDKLRADFKRSDDVRDAGLTTPDDIVRYDDICYGEDKKWQMLDVYRPKDKKDDILPVIVSVHGGGWVYGDKERYQYYCMDLAERGFAVVNFTYRLAPEFKFPSPLEDTNLVIGWIMKNKEKYGFDVNNIFAVGDSAGAHILGLYTSICTNTEYAENFDFTVPEGFCFRAVALNCGAYEILMEKDGALMEDYLPEKGSERELELINVPGHITGDYPPVFLMTCTGDFLIDQPLLMIKKMTGESVPFEYRFYGDKKNSLGHVFHCNIRLEAAKICNDDECEFFKKIAVS